MEQEGQRVVICMSSGPDVVDRRVFLLASWVILHIAKVFQPLRFISMTISKVVLIDLEDVGEETQQG